ncbi:MAG TPA: hypothetical protein PLE33_08930 [Candidatus Cloacimonas sp.]|nr:hypothetical protein [Candidatus Cloacimonas sp.]
MALNSAKMAQKGQIMNGSEREYSRRYWKKQEGGYIMTGICTLCGAEFNNGNAAAASYCQPCAEKVKREKTAARVRRYRERQGKQ